MSVKHWLDSLSLTQYHDLFLSNGFESLTKCSTLTDTDLDRIGVTLPGHRKRILSHLQTALHFSTMKQDDSISHVEQNVTDESSAKNEDLIDLKSPDYVNLKGEEMKKYPFGLPPKLQKETPIDDLHGLPVKNDGGLDSDKKRPVPLPRTSIRLNPPGDVPVPVPRPRVKKSTGKVVTGVTESDSTTDNNSKLTDASDIKKSLGLEQIPASNALGKISEKETDAGKESDHITDSSNKLDNCDKAVELANALSITELSAASNNSSADGKVDELNLIFSPVNLAEETDHIPKALLTTEPEGLNSGTASPDLAMTDTGNGRFPVSDNYEGDIEDVESSGGSDFVNIIKCLRNKEGLDHKVAYAGDSDQYTGVWNMTSGKAARQYRNEINSDESVDDIEPEYDESEYYNVVSKNSPLNLPQLLAPDVTLVSHPAPTVPSRPPPVPSRTMITNNIPTELKHRKSPSTSSVKLLLPGIEQDVFATPRVSPLPLMSSTPDLRSIVQVDLLEEEASGFPKPPPHTIPPPVPISSAEERVKAHPRFPTPPLHSAPLPAEAGLPEGEMLIRPPIPIPPVRAAPTPPVEGGMAVYPLIPVPAARATPTPPVEGGIAVHPLIPVPAVRVAPTPPVARQVKDEMPVQASIPTPPVRAAPPPPVACVVEERTAVPPILTPPVRAAPPPPVGPLDVKVPTVSTPVVKTPLRGTPPRPPPKVGVPSHRATYCFAEDIDDDEPLDEPDAAGDVSFAESDDTLSDGGEFYDIGFRRPSGDVLSSSIPILPSSPSTPMQFQNGMLHKLTSKSGVLTKLGPSWQRRYVVFDGRELRYYSSNKSFISKRIIPVCTMETVETENKIGELFPFRLRTIDRVYTFAADKLDDMVIWAQVIMRAILESKTERASFVEGGEMNSPDIQGYVRMEGSKSKRYLVVKKPKFCYYNTQNDFLSFTPIHRVEMQVASVKDVGRFRLKLITPHIAIMLIYDNQEDLNLWKDAFEEAIMTGLSDDKVIEEIYTNENNRTCADCGMQKPDWASINLGITLCKFCAGIHRSLSWSKVRSLRMDCKIWRPSVKQLLIAIGNDNSNKFWEWNLTTEAKITADTNIAKRKNFIVQKYCDKLFCHFHPFHGKQDLLNEALCKMVQFGNVFETLELLFSGANIVCTKDNETPIQIARKANQVLQEEFLAQNGGDVAPLPSPQSGVELQRAGTCHQGFLWKTGSNYKEFLRRWCTLDNEKLSYFDTDKSTEANKSILKKEMQSIGRVCDERYEYTFEIRTTIEGNRAFLFAADSAEDRLQWMTKLAQMIGNISQEDVENITAMDHGGNIFMRWGSARDWELSWVQILHKTLKIFNKKVRSFIEVDLRKAKLIAFRPTSERCIESFDDGPPFFVDLRNAKYLYLQGDMRNETECWFSVIHKAMMEADGCLANQSLTCDNVPVIVEKCISFVELYGIEVEGIYRLNGQHSKVTRLLELFLADACGIMLKLEEFQVHDVATALKRFFRTLKDSLLTYKLYSKWVEAAGMSDQMAKMQLYKNLLQKLPEINYCTLKQIVTHLIRVAECERVNKMTVINLASIFGPVLMRLDNDTHSNGGYGSTNLEILVVKDLIEGHLSLFEVKEEELEQEKKIEEARKKIEMLNSQQAEGHLDQMQDVLIGVYIKNKEGEVVTLKVPVQMRVQELQNYVIEKAKLNADQCWSLYEVICNGELERPLHYVESVIEVTMRWAEWPIEFCRDNYLCIKRNTIYEGIEQVGDPHASMFCELKYASKKSFHKYCFEFSRYCLTYRSNAKASSPTASWNVEDLIIYLGCQKQRSPPTKWCFSFICAGEQLVSPFFGHCICCNSEEELYRWLSVLLRAQHPEGLYPIGMARTGNSPPVLPQTRSSGANAGQDVPSASETSRSRWPKPGFFQKFSLK